MGPGTPVKTLKRHHRAVPHPGLQRFIRPIVLRFLQNRLAGWFCKRTFQPYQRAGQMFVFYGLNVDVQERLTTRSTTVSSWIKSIFIYQALSSILGSGVSLPEAESSVSYYL